MNTCRKGHPEYSTVRCPECRREADRRYHASEKGQARAKRWWARYSGSEKDRVQRAQHKSRYIRVRLGGETYSYPVRPEKKEEIQETLRAYRREHKMAGR